MTERLLLAFAVLTVVVLTGVLLRRILARRRERLLGQIVPAGTPGIVCFSGPGCPTCGVQSEILDTMRRSGLIDVEVRHVDAASNFDLARQYGVVVVPTTVVSDANGRVVGINSGLADIDVLSQRLHHID